MKHHILPFRIVVDSNEGHPYSFARLKDGKGTKILARYIKKPLYLMSQRSYQISTGEHIDAGLADYSIEDHEEEVQIERKSVSDLFQSLGNTRDRMEARYMRLAECHRAYLLIEGEWSDIFRVEKIGSVTAKQISRTHDAWTLRWPNVHWVMMPGRPAAEEKCFRLLLKYFMEFVDPSCPRY